MVPLRAGALNKSLVVNRSRSISSVKIFNISVGRKVLMSSFSRDQEQGRDSLGNTYQSRSEMWLLEAGETGSKVDNLKKEQWYKKGVEYWKNINPTVDGVLGGYELVNDMDVKESSIFIEEMCRGMFASVSNQGLCALDCGAGIGRVTQNLLSKYFSEVHLVEPLDHFLSTAEKNLKPLGDATGRQFHFICESLENFIPEKERYDVIWVQWCIGHLTDADFISFFERAKEALKQGGILFLKENVCHSGFVVDKADSSVTRSDAIFRKLFKQAGFTLIKAQKQREFPEGLFQVQMYALVPEQHNPRTTYNTRSKNKKGVKNAPGIIR